MNRLKGVRVVGLTAVAILAIAASSIPAVVSATSQSSQTSDVAPWKSVGTMHQAREGGGAGNGHIGAVLDDGRVLVAGGFSPRLGFFSTFDARNYLSESELYDPVTSSWSRAARMHESRFAPEVVKLPSGKVLVAGGAGDLVNRRSAEIYDPAANSWTPTGRMRDCRLQASSSLLKNGKVLVAGGAGCDTDTQTSAELYDSLTGAWTPTGSMRTPRAGAGVVTLPDGRVLVVGGRNAAAGRQEFVSSAEIYDPASNAWSDAGRTAAPLSAVAAGLLSSGKVIAVGGNSEAAHLFDPSTRAWRPTAPMSAKRLFAGAIAVDRSPGRLFLVAGGGGQASAEYYEESTGSWLPAGNLTQVRDDVQLFALSNGDILVAGGFQSGKGSYRTSRTTDVLPAAALRMKLAP